MRKKSVEKNSALFSGRIVQILVIIAASITTLGGIRLLISSANNPYSYNQFVDNTAYPTTIKSIITGVLSFDSNAIIQLGVLVLIAIPVIRVVEFLGSFIRERDWIYVAVSVIVLAVLLYSLSGGGF